MAQFNITLTEEHLHGLFTGDGRDQAFAKLLEEIFNQVLLAQSREQRRPGGALRSTGFGKCHENP